MHGRDAVASERLDGGAFRALDLTPDDAEFGHHLSPAPARRASWRRGSIRGLHSPDADAGATLAVRTREIAASRCSERRKFNRIVSSARILVSVCGCLRRSARPRWRRSGAIRCRAKAYGFKTQSPLTWVRAALGGERKARCHAASSFPTSPAMTVS